MTFYNQFPCLTKEGRKEKHTYFSHLFQIDFCIGSHPSFTDEIHDPLFALIARNVESLKEVAGCKKSQTGTPEECWRHTRCYLLMNHAICLVNQVPSIVQKLISKLVQEEILPNNLYSKGQLPLCCLKIKLHIKLLQKRGDRVLVLIFFRRIAALARYRSIHGPAVWIVLRYVGDRNVSRRRVRPCG